MAVINWIIALTFSLQALHAREQEPYEMIVLDKDLKIIDKRTSNYYIFKHVRSYPNLSIILPFERQLEEIKPIVDKEKINMIIEKSKLLFSRGQYKKAWDALEDADDQDPNNPTIKTMQGSLQLQMGNYKEAQRLYEESLKYNSNQPGVKEQLKYIRDELKGSE